MPRGGSYAAAMGRAGTLRSLSQAIRDRRARKKGEAAEAEAEKISSIRVPIGRARPQAMPSPIGEAIEERKVQDEIAAQPEAVAPTDQAAAQEQYEETNRAIQETKDLEVRAVDELPMMKQLEPYPSAKNRLMQLAEANGWVKMIGGVATISNKQMKIAQGIIAGDLNLRKEMNELALNDLTMNIANLQEAKLDPKLKEEDAANIDAQLEQLRVEQGNKLNAVNMMDREIQKGLALQRPEKEKTTKKDTVTLEVGKDGKDTPGVTHIWTVNPATGQKDQYVGQAKTTKSGALAKGGGVKRTVADTKEANKSILQRILAGTNIDINEIFNNATGTVNEGLFRQKLRRAAEDAEGDEKKDLMARYKKYGKLKQLAQRNLRDSEMTIEDSVVQGFKDAGLGHLLGEYVAEGEGEVPKGTTKGKDLVEYAPGEKGYPIYDADGTLIGHERVR